MMNALLKLKNINHYTYKNWHSKAFFRRMKIFGVDSDLQNKSNYYPASIMQQKLPL